MLKQTPLVLVAAFAVTIGYVGYVGPMYRADVVLKECIGKTYGVPGCPLKHVSDTCGDGVVDDGEECDNGMGRNGSGNCSNSCQFLACGDGVLSEELGEECEPPREEVYMLDPETGELTTEILFLSPSCGISCTVPTCNDDGVCSGGCARVLKTACGASSAAREQSSSSLRAAAPSSEAISYVPRCGNGTKDSGEQCDDGNTIDTDGCTIACKTPRCGDGAVQQGEECDDGNRIDNDDCSNSCAHPRCGDAIVQHGEQCDAGGNNSDYRADSCRENCMAAYCGDGVTDDGEECDGGDTCSSDCVRIKSFGALFFDTPGIDKAAIVLSALGGAFVLAFVFRALVKRFARHVGGEKLARSIDEIPLDEIEMPWMKW